MRFIISDVHGCFYTLQKLIQRVRDYDPTAQLIFVGDYIDRGLHNREVIDYLIELQKNGAIFVRGNHDNVVDWLLNDHFVGHIREFVVGEPSPQSVVRWWLCNGFNSTLESYGVHCQTSGNFAEAFEQFRKNVSLEHKQFFAQLPLYWESDTHFVCHAYMRPDEELPRSLKFLPNDRVDEIMWSRFPAINGTFKATMTLWDRIGVFGHSPTLLYNSPVPISFDKIRLIDAGVALGGYLCAYCCERDDYLLQATDSRDISAKNDYDGNLVIDDLDK